jgi:DNA polymerase-3 subunit alpha
MKEKGLFNLPVYRERIKYEMGVIVGCKYTKYFLILWDIINFARREKIRIGVGRGSAVSSLCLYVLGITGLDPLKYDLIFERFLNPERISPPDVDVDFDYDRRDEIFAYIIRKYGDEYCSKIGTYNKLKARAAIRGTAKALDIGNDWEAYQAKLKKNPDAKIEMTKDSLSMADAISKQIPFKATMTIEQALKSSSDFRDSMRQFPKLLDCSRRIERNLASAGVHPAGILICKDKVI